MSHFSCISFSVMSHFTPVISVASVLVSDFSHSTSELSGQSPPRASGERKRTTKELKISVTLNVKFTQSINGKSGPFDLAGQIIIQQNDL